MRSLLLVLAGCASQADLEPSDSYLAQEPDQSVQSEGLTLVVHPGQTHDPDGAVRALPVRLQAPSFDVTHQLALLEPFTLEGSLWGRQTQSIDRIDLPGIDGPVQADVHFVHDAALERWRAVADPAGRFSIDLVAGEHTVTVAPEDPALPLWRLGADLAEDRPFDLELDAGVAIYGRVMEGDAPLPGASVVLRTEDDIVGPEVFADEDGWYQLRAQEGLVVSAQTRGLGDGVQPVLRSDPALPPSEGLRLDLVYPDRPVHTVSARILTPGGQGARQVPYRLRSVRIGGYEGLASVEQTGFTDNSGNVVTRTVDGRYVLDLLVQEPGVAGKALPITVSDGDVLLGTHRLDGEVTLRTTVVDPDGLPMPSTRVTCAEAGLAQRAWSGDTDLNGELELVVPRGDLSCVALPSADARDGVAAARFDVTGWDLPATGGVHPLDVVLPPGRTLAGRVVFQGEPEPLALVEVRGPSGELLATDLTDELGRFALRVSPSAP